jgi:hypothetical protein
MKGIPFCLRSGLPSAQDLAVTESRFDAEAAGFEPRMNSRTSFVIQVVSCLALVVMTPRDA